MNTAEKIVSVYLRLNGFNCNFIPSDGWRGHIEYGKME